MKSLDRRKSSNQQTGKYLEELVGTKWLGYVVDSNDPLMKGRCKIRIFEKFDKLEDAVLPWAHPMHSTVFAGGESHGFGSFSYPKVDTLVEVEFNNGDIYAPEYRPVMDINESMQTEIKQSYENCQVLVYDEDEDMKILYTKEKGLLIHHKSSIINIDKNKHITIEHAGKPSIITMIDGVVSITTTESVITKTPFIWDNGKQVDVGRNNHERAVRCDSLIHFLLLLAAIIDSKIPLAGTPALNLVKKWEDKICSATVNIAE